MINLFRDDDVSKYTDIQTFLKIHDLFKKYKKVHTCAVEMDGLFDSRGVWHLLQTEPLIEIGLHGWTHKDYSILSYDEICDDFKKSLDYWNSHSYEGYGKVIQIKTYYPTWNRVSDNLMRACATYRLKLDARVGGEVFNFHWWNFITDMDGLKKALRTT